MLRVVLSNIDWISLNIMLDEPSLFKFKYNFSQLIDKYACSTTFIGKKWVIRPHHSRKGLIELTNEEGYIIEVNINEKGNDYPMILSLKKPERRNLPCLLWESPIASMKSLIEDIEKEYTIEYNIKRIDLACHFQGWIPSPKDIDNYHGYPVSPYKPGKVFTGFCIGYNRSKSKRVEGTLYNIEERIKDIPGSYIPYQYYNSNYVQDDPTWNLEFKIYRNMMKEYDINKLDDITHKIPAIWKYLTEKKFRYVVPSVMDTNKARWKDDPNWQTVQSAFGNIITPIVKNKKIKVAKLPISKKIAKLESTLASIIVECEYWDLPPDKKLESVLYGLVNMDKFTNESLQVYIRNRREIRN